MPTTLFPKADKTVHPVAPDTMLSFINACDWSSTSLGPITEWPSTVRVSVRLILSSALPMCLMVGREGIMIYNDAYIEVAGGRHPGSLGSSVFDSWPEVADFNRDVIDTVMQGKTLAFENQHFVFHRNGSAEDVWLDLDYSPVLGDDGEAIATLAILSDMTKRVLVERALARSEERLSMAFSASGIAGAWDWKIDSDVVITNSHFAVMYGVSPGEAEKGVPITRFFEAVHPEDRPSLSKAIDEAVQDRKDFRAEYRLIDEQGKQRWIMATGKVVADASTGELRLPGVIIDITERKAFEEALAASEAGFRTLADTMPQMVWSTLPDGYHDYYNARWYEYTGVPEGSTNGEAWNGMFHPDDRERSFQAWNHSLTTGEPYQVEYRLRHHTGEYRWTLGRALPIRNEAGEIIRWIGTCTDIHETKIASEEREMVAQELSHRIKNIFSVLNGIISLSSRSYPQIKPLTDELRQRIAAMGKAHDFVRPHSSASKPAVNQSSLWALIIELIAPHQGAGAQRIVLEGDDPLIDDGAATPLALIFHELSTNAAKYGALATQEGYIHLSSVLEGGNYRMVWKELGGKPISPDARKEGFGTKLIALSVHGQLNGSITRHWDEDGLRVELLLPAAQLNKSTTLRA
ncbi:PAS domain-containing protein [Corticibacterium sp. UT-5YL-CI-8]|nr:PAS domain-containing protein [Tianweitania sp. UT-5YL-CI-8]